MLSYINSFLSIVLLISLIFPAAAGAETPDIPLVPALLFSEVKINHDTANLTDIDEFIELYNPTTEIVDLSKYEIHYFNNLTPSVIVPTKKIQPVHAGQLLPGQHILLAENQLHSMIPAGTLTTDLLTSGLRNDFGRLHLVEISTGNAVDTVAWSSTDGMADTYVSATNLPAAVVCASCATDKVRSLTRPLDNHQLYSLLKPSWQLQVPTPGYFGLYNTPPSPGEEPVIPDTPIQPVPSQPQMTCEGVILTELLPNPAGSDSEGEFIELYNPTDDTINLSGCSLQVSGSSKQFYLADSISPGAYTVFSAKVTGLTLPNSIGGTVWLLSPTEEIDSTTYPGNLDDDASWSLGDSTWQISYQITSGSLNIMVPVRPCPTGQIRNVDTDRCQVPVTAAVANLTPCRVGQERNLETNRCRTIGAVTSAVLVACKEGQERNPETNRCRTIAGEGELAACAEGQERNPETNRCRKVTAEGTTLAAVTDVQSPVKVSTQKWWIAGVMLLAVIGYAVYEWRQDILLLGKSLLSKTGVKK